MHMQFSVCYFIYLNSRFNILSYTFVEELEMKVLEIE